MQTGFIDFKQSMNNLVISVIVPVYNAEHFLGNLIESILVQSFTEFELIVINDGSTDNTEEIIVNYAIKDKRVKLLNKLNEGVSIARNTALKYARGKYIYFADADDLLMPDALQTLFDAAIHYNADYVRADHRTIGKNGEELFPNKRFYIRKRFGNRILDSGEVYGKILLDEFFLWVCLFRRDIIVDNKMEFIPHCRFMEDAAFIVEYLTYCKRCVYIPEYVYNYRIYGETAGQAKKDNNRDLIQINSKTSFFEQTVYVRVFKKKIENKIINKRRLLQILIQRYDKIVINIKYLLCK